MLATGLDARVQPPRGLWLRVVQVLNLAPDCLGQLDGFYRFELHRRDEREIVKMLVDLSVREPGEVSLLTF